MSETPAAPPDAVADRALSSFLIGLVAYLFVLAPLVPASTLGRIVLDAGFVGVLFSAVFAVAPHRRHRLLALALFVVSVATRVALRAAPSPALETGHLLSALAFVALVTFLLFGQVMRPGAISSHRVRGAIAVYLLLGLAWGLAYALPPRCRPGARYVFVGCVFGPDSGSLAAVVRICKIFRLEIL